ncbi:MAG: hypothetical protein U0796_10130 [Gemmatales bacterium]
MYKFERGANGEIFGVRKEIPSTRSDTPSTWSELIPEDYSNPEYCEFLTWAARHNAEIQELCISDSRSIFLASENHLLQYCKDNGELLWTTDRGNRAFEIEHYDISNTAQCRVQAHLQDGSSNYFVRLRTAVADPASTTGLIEHNSNIFIPHFSLNHINDQLAKSEDTFRRITNWPLNRSFVYLDVSDFSSFPAGTQAVVINSIIRIVQHKSLWIGVNERANWESMICIGDGYIFAFKDACDAAFYAAILAYYIEGLIALKKSQIIPVEFHFRIGIHTGPVYSFWDIGKNDWNYIGDGINGGQRVLAAAGKEKDDVIYLSDEVRKQIIQNNFHTGHHLKDMRKTLTNRGRHKDKHDRSWRIYEMNHDEMVNIFGFTQLYSIE